MEDPRWEYGEQWHTEPTHQSPTEMLNNQGQAALDYGPAMRQGDRSQMLMN